MAGTDTAGELAVELRPRLTRLAHLLRRQTVELPLSMAQSQVLGQVLGDRPRTIGELAAAEGVQLPTMTQIVDRMERQGWVRRQSRSGDRRCVEVAITAAGGELVREVVARRTALLRVRLERLSRAERVALERALPALDRLLDP